VIIEIKYKWEIEGATNEHLCCCWGGKYCLVWVGGRGDTTQIKQQCCFISNHVYALISMIYYPVDFQLLYVSCCLALCHVTVSLIGCVHWLGLIVASIRRVQSFINTSWNGFSVLTCVLLCVCPSVCMYMCVSHLLWFGILCRPHALQSCLWTHLIIYVCVSVYCNIRHAHMYPHTHTRTHAHTHTQCSAITLHRPTHYTYCIQIGKKCSLINAH